MAAQVGRNKVFLDKYQIINIIVCGNQTADTINKNVTDTQPYIKRLERACVPICHLVDLTEAGHTSISSHKASLNALKTLHYHKIAIFGVPIYLRAIINTLVAASGKSQQVKVFESKDAARDWLIDTPENSSETSE